MFLVRVQLCVNACACAEGAPADSTPAPGAGALPTLCGDGTKFNVRDRAFSRDPRPLVPGCTCYTCRNHNRAYVHHLLNVHEMLGPTLLQVHNTHHYLRLFARVRDAVAEDTLPAFVDWFVKTNALE